MRVNYLTECSTVVKWVKTVFHSKWVDCTVYFTRGGQNLCEDCTVNIFYSIQWWLCAVFGLYVTV